MFLSKSHIEKKNILIIKLKSKDKIEERRLNFPWEDLFDLKIKFDVLEFNLENKKRTNLLENNLFVRFNLSRFNVLSLKKIRNIFYKCSLFFFDKFSFSNKEHFGLFIDNYTMREAAVNLVLKGYGITKHTKKYADFLVKIKINDKIESLNVSNSASIVFHYINQHKK